MRVDLLEGGRKSPLAGLRPERYDRVHHRLPVLPEGPRESAGVPAAGGPGHVERAHHVCGPARKSVQRIAMFVRDRFNVRLEK